MLDLPQQFAGFAEALQSQDYPEVATIAALLHLDISKATASKSERGVLAMYGARFND